MTVRTTAIEGRRPEIETAAAEVLVVGGGIAGLEALLALHELAGERASLTLISKDSEFIYRPTAVAQPLSPPPPEHHDLAAIAAELGARFVPGALAAVDPQARTISLDRGDPLAYDAAVICIGARTRAPFPEASTLIGPGYVPDVNQLLARAARHHSRRIAFVVPPGVTWPLPIYELALMTGRRARELGYGEVETVIVTPEAGPLIMFGPIASRRVYDLLRARGISFLPAMYASHEDGEGIVLSPGHSRLEAGAVVALPVLDGPAIEGLPHDRGGFIPIDDRARVEGCEGVYAAGDGTTFPIKQGGIATQQADAAAEQIAAELGCISDPHPFHPVLRGKLIAGEEALHLRADIGGGGGVGVASQDYLWWPPHKVAARYLARWLEGERRDGEPEPPRPSIDVEVALPREWHREPMALDPYSSLGQG